MTWTNRILVALLVAAAVAIVPRSDVPEDDDLSRAEQERAQLETNIERLRGEIAVLEAEVAALHRDPRADEDGAIKAELARIAREDLNLIRPGEVVFEVTEVDR